jgi:hypothetical protein
MGIKPSRLYEGLPSFFASLHLSSCVSLVLYVLSDSTLFCSVAPAITNPSNSLLLLRKSILTPFQMLALLASLLPIAVSAAVIDVQVGKGGLLYDPPAVVSPTVLLSS